MGQGRAGLEACGGAGGMVGQATASSASTAPRDKAYTPTALGNNP